MGAREYGGPCSLITQGGGEETSKLLERREEAVQEELQCRRRGAGAAPGEEMLLGKFCVMSAFREQPQEQKTGRAGVGLAQATWADGALGLLVLTGGQRESTRSSRGVG